MVDKVNNINVTQLLNTAMHHASVKQEIIAQNLAEANVPGAFAKTLANLDEKNFRRPARISLAVTSNIHLAGSPSMPNHSFRVEVDRDLSNMTPSGNNISVIEQTEALSRNNIDYSIYVDIYNKLRDLERKAIEG